jgi:murein DD-endopeptidase MepM/ murein hydrolase activator NlpD
MFGQNLFDFKKSRFKKALLSLCCLGLTAFSLQAATLMAQELVTTPSTPLPQKKLPITTPINKVIPSVASPNRGCATLIQSEAPFDYPETVKQGQVFRVKLNTSTCQLDSTSQVFGKADLAGRTVSFFPDSSGQLQALVPVSVFQKPGVFMLSVFDAENRLVRKAPVTIQNGWYKTQNIVVKSTTAGLQPLPGEMEAIGALKDRITYFPFWTEPFITPTPDCENSPFGVKRLHNGKATGNYHKGIDLKSPLGRPVKATNAGKVVIAKNYRLHGGTVGLDHGLGVSSIYIHMSKILVSEGQTVKKGEVVGLVGATGFASGPHLHWGLYVGGLPVNPNQWLAPVPKCY